jgi:hypothetical protein
MAISKLPVKASESPTIFIPLINLFRVKSLRAIFK